MSITEEEAFTPDEPKSFWLSWHHTKDMGPFEYHGPWWVSGSRVDDDAATICAAVMAHSETGAKMIIGMAYDKLPDPPIEWRFCSEKTFDGFPPGGDRFPRADWMKWPWPESRP